MSTRSLPTIIENEINALIKGGYFSSKDSFIEEAIKYRLTSRGDLKINDAVEMYRSISIFEFKEILKARGIKTVVDAPSKEDLDRQIRRMDESR